MAYQPTVTVAIVGAATRSDELKPPTSSYAKPSCQNFEQALAVEHPVVQQRFGRRRRLRRRRAQRALRPADARSFARPLSA